MLLSIIWLKSWRSVFLKTKIFYIYFINIQNLHIAVLFFSYLGVHFRTNLSHQIQWKVILLNIYAPWKKWEFPIDTVDNWDFLLKIYNMVYNWDFLLKNIQFLKLHQLHSIRHSILYFLLLICSCVTADSNILSKENKNLNILLYEVEMAKYSKEGIH